eukprot:7974218-Pyramimonas_sp.AAC.1
MRTAAFPSSGHLGPHWHEPRLEPAHVPDEARDVLARGDLCPIYRNCSCHIALHPLDATIVFAGRPRGLFEETRDNLFL